MSDPKAGAGAEAGELAVRGSFLHFVDDPELDENACHFLEDGLLVLKQGRIVSLGDYRQQLESLVDGTEVIDYSGKLVLPGFIDTHCHYPQTGIIASYGAQLLDWLEKYTFPAEARFGDREHADEVAGFFCDELLRNGTTTAGVFATVHAGSVDAIFAAAAARGMALVSGKVLMDRNGPAHLLDSVESGYRDSVELIRRWHGRDRACYAVTPRFVPTSTPGQLEMAGQLLREFEGLYLQSHVAENQHEVAWVGSLFSERRSYLDVYDHFGLLGPRSVLAHGIYLDNTDRACLAERGASIAFCPTSNLFLGSGLFDLARAERYGIRVGLATDVGAGTSFSLLQTLNEAYKVCQLNGRTLSPLKAFYLATLGGARSLRLEHRVGNFEIGREADFVVIDRAATPLLQRRLANSTSIADQLFALMMLGDDRCIHATHTLGRCRYSKDG